MSEFQSAWLASRASPCLGQNLSNLSWAMATMELHDSKLIEAISLEAKRKAWLRSGPSFVRQVPMMQSQDLANTAGGSGGLGARIGLVLRPFGGL